MARSRPHIALLLDFDGTITKTDTTAIIGSKCLAKAQELTPPDAPGTQQPKSMDFYSQKYLQEYQAWKGSQTRPLEDCCSSVEDVVSYLSASRSVEEKSFLRVREAVLGASDRMREMENDRSKRHEFMVECGRLAVRSGELKIRDRESLRQLFSLADEEGRFWSIISVSWSRRFILGALIEAGLVDEARMKDVVERIHCNELLAPVQHNKDGHPVIICSAQDKLVVMSELMSALPLGRKKGVVVVYVGDSSTDVGCLATAAIGFHLNNNPGSENHAIQTVKKCGIESRTIDELIASPSLLDPIIEEQEAGGSFHAITEVTSFDSIWEWASRCTKRA